jgi:hypothetical protein
VSPLKIAGMDEPGKLPARQTYHSAFQPQLEEHISGAAKNELTSSNVKKYFAVTFDSFKR